MNPKIEILLSSDRDYENLVAEMYLDGKFIALLNQDLGVDNLVIELTHSQFSDDDAIRKLNLNDFEEALTRAKKKLLG